MRLKPDFVEITSPFPEQPGKLRYLADTAAPDGGFCARLLDGSHDGKPFLLENATTRALLFNLDFIQSSMRLDAPEALELLYTQKMMAFLLFHTNVKRILLLGLGGGSLAKFCRRHLPQADFTAVEAAAEVLVFRDEFHIPPDGELFRVVVSDAGEYVAACTQEFDVILVDAFDSKGFAAKVSTPDFYRQAWDRLPAKGVLVANLVGESAARRAHLELIQEAFGDNLLLVSVEGGYNHVCFAFRDRQFEPRWKWITGQARAMRARYGLDFPGMAARLERNWRLGWENVLL